MSKEKTLGQRLGEAMIREAKKMGIPAYTTIITFPNQDAYEFLERLQRFEEHSKKINIRIGSEYLAV
ncbi:MAG: hypothetical protein PHF67_00610 [Candidatus Nanoarchaeia archaeon]|nr:hypothetical protein [Candidatus Nanoarchaeia archaeon]